VIDVLVAHPTQRFTLTELSRRTAVNPASAHALLAVMLRAGYVQRHPEHKTYSLGPALVAAGETALEQLPALRMARDRLGSLSNELELEVVLTSPTEDEIIFVARAGRPSAFGLVLQVGQRSGNRSFPRQHFVDSREVCARDSGILPARFRGGPRGSILAIGF